ncbi:MAG: RNA polymerase sporulation sigma factor SigK [Clostridia bacterium]|nr:RNA polymerase sporulation sigma factor SigK [Clostridia bacterium]
MFAFLGELLSKISLLFILHVTGGGAFPRPLSESEEEKYLQLARKGDINARNILVEHNLRLVAHIVKKYYGTGFEQDDLVSVGTIGLIKAINTFKADKNIKLSSYASRCIENEILMYFRGAKKNSLDVSINEEIDSDTDGNALTLMDIMSAEDNIVENLDRKIQTEKLPKYINEALTPREKLIIKLRYGLDGKDALTQREVAKMLKISRSYVSRIEKKALSELKKRYDKG